MSNNPYKNTISDSSTQAKTTNLDSQRQEHQDVPNLKSDTVIYEDGEDSDEDVKRI